MIELEDEDWPQILDGVNADEERLEIICSLSRAYNELAAAEWRVRLWRGAFWLLLFTVLCSGVGLLCGGAQ